MTDREPNSYERLTPEAQHAFGVRRVNAALDRYESADKLASEWKLHETSRLAQDNAASSVYRRMSEELHFQINSARDHLRHVHAGVRVAEHVSPFAPFTLIRSAIESAAYGLWLQKPGTLNARIARLLQLQWDQRVSVDRYTSAVGIDNGPNTAKLAQWLAETRHARPGIQRDFREAMPTTTDVLIETDKLFKPRLSQSGLNAWRACSGVTHGNVHFASAVMTESAIADAAPGEPTRLQSASMPGLGLMLDPAVSYFQLLIETARTHSEPRPGHPSYV